MTTELTIAAHRVVSTQHMLTEPYVPTARNSPRPDHVAKTRRMAASEALHDLSVASASAKWPRAWVDATADGLKVHKVRNNHDAVACTGALVPGKDITASVVALRDIDPCLACDWRLL